MSAAEKIIQSAVAHRHSFDSLSMHARAVLLRGLKVVLDNSKTDEEYEEATALSALLIDDLDGATATAAVARIPHHSRHGFHEIETGEPISGLPPASQCPFCKDGDDWIGIVTVPGQPERKTETTYHVQCDSCGCEGPGGMTKLEAAEAWNKGSRVDYSVIETLDGINLSLEQLSDVLRIAVDSLRLNSVVEDAPAMASIEAAIDARLFPAREQLRDLLLQKLAPQSSER